MPWPIFSSIWRMYSHLLVFRWFAAPGRMALTNYIGQSVAVWDRFWFGIGNKPSCYGFDGSDDIYRAIVIQ